MNQLPYPENKIIESTANIAKTIHTIQSEPVAKSANFIYILLLKFHFLNFINLNLVCAFINFFQSTQVRSWNPYFFQVHLWLLHNMIFLKKHIPMKDILPYSQTAYQSAHTGCCLRENHLQQLCQLFLFFNCNPRQ